MTILLNLKENFEIWVIKILIVEDLEIAQKIAKVTLMYLGYHVDIAEIGQKAFEMF